MYHIIVPRLYNVLVTMGVLAGTINVRSYEVDKIVTDQFIAMELLDRSECQYIANRNEDGEPDQFIPKPLDGIEMLLPLGMGILAKWKDWDLTVEEIQSRYKEVGLEQPLECYCYRLESRHCYKKYNEFLHKYIENLESQRALFLYKQDWYEQTIREGKAICEMFEQIIYIMDKTSNIYYRRKSLKELLVNVPDSRFIFFPQEN